MGMATATKGSHKKGAKKIICEINITPLTDIFLVLLIIMMVVAPTLTNSNNEIETPTVTSGDTLDPNRLTVEVTADGSFFIDGTATPQEELVVVMKDRIEDLEEKDVIIRADKAARSRSILAIFEAARDAAFEKVTVAGESLSDERQADLLDPLSVETQ